MAQRKRPKLQFRARLSQWQAALFLCLFLCLFLAVRGLVPAGFMPASLAAGTPYGLCHGDGRSALLLNALAQWEHAHHGAGHDHSALTAQAFADNHCSFSAGAGIATAPTLELAPLFDGGQQPTNAPPRNPPQWRLYVLPPKRAPPISRSA
ncbi:hypothetical protein SAMN04487965_1729 [Microbulbifer donghaiensis]|uniref:DUF2946 domain-containing protein n=1 Tax=Microbulbifer donghaiensis TaxID=494016 RepID=A0A1M5A2T3_9GAMM|nr:hypothetical protein [Microbulbifer donghaiensis]SHF24561.1 hypothetical protein SAMN04487965_1729 [Microbulbifer donghaiensis]